MWKSDVTGPPLFLFAKSGNLNIRGCPGGRVTTARKDWETLGWDGFSCLPSWATCYYVVKWHFRKRKIQIDKTNCSAHRYVLGTHKTHLWAEGSHAVAHGQKSNKPKLPSFFVACLPWTMKPYNQFCRSHTYSKINMLWMRLFSKSRYRVKQGKVSVIIM